MRSSALPILLALVVLTGLALWLLGGDSSANPGPADNAPPTNDQPETTAPIPEKQAPVRDPGAPPRSTGPQREEVGQVELGAASNSAQGVEGRLLSPTRSPIQGAEVYLVHGVGMDSLQLLMRTQRGEHIPPLAKAVSNAEGRFRVGLETYDKDRTFEIRVLHPDFCDRRIERITIQPKDWFDAGDVELKPGTTVFGTVFAESGSPIANATVTARLQFTHSALSIPGRESGLEARTNEAGDYELKNVDANDIQGFSAHALHHTRAEKTEFDLSGDRVRIDFHLGSGFEIGGAVVDAAGKPIAGAKLTAMALSQKAPQTEETYSKRDGTFLLVGLRDAQFMVIAEAEGFARVEEKPVKAGDQEVSILMERLGSVEVTVSDAAGRALSSYTCNIKAVISGDDNFGKPMLTKDVKNASGGRALISGLNAGPGGAPMRYVAEILHPQYAKSFSPPFTIAAGQTEPARVEVRLNMGGTLRGVVQDSNGKPVAGVTVATQPKGMIENKLVEAFGGIAYTITRGSTKTAADGSFELRRLLPGEYQLKFSHANYCTTVTKGNMAVLDQVTDVPAVTLERGAQVSGVARVEGKPTGQVKVTVSAKSTEDNPVMFSTEAITDNEGLFLLPKRLPPGEYEARGAQMSGGPFAIIMQFQKVTRFAVRPGSESQQLIIDVPPLPK